jgi:hypothetical protein
MEAHENIMSFFILQTIVILLDFCCFQFAGHLKFPYERTAFLRMGLLNKKLP